MAYSEMKDLLSAAREKFIAGDYTFAQPILEQIILKNSQLPEVYQMLATIYYEQGKFNKAIKTFKRALEVEPNYTDASIGLSIILNDIGRYDEAKKIFEDAQARLDKNKRQKKDSFMEEKLSAKHLDLGAMYFHYQRYDDAIEQYKKALELTTKKAEVTMSLVECYLKSGAVEQAIQALKKIVQLNPQFLPARTKLGVIFYNADRIAEATSMWEGVLLRDPNYNEAKTYLRLARDAGITALT